MARGVLGGTYLGFRLVETDLCAAGKCHLLDVRVAAALVMRRDVTI